MLSLGELWFASASTFNDPFDTSIPHRVDLSNRQQLARWANDFFRREFPQFDRASRRRAVRLRLKEIRKDREYAERQHAIQVEQNIERFGICSLCATKESTLLWGHYADGHRGFCVGLGADRIRHLQELVARDNRLLQLVRVEYEKNMPQINLFASILEDTWEAESMKVLKTKSKEWDYEQEWRLVLWNATQVALQAGSLIVSEITLGCRVDPNRRTELLLFMDKIEAPIPVYEAVKHRTEFRFQFVKIR